MNDNVVLVTGASAGIGHATALSLLERGATVVAAARRLERMRDLAKAGAHVVQLDVADPASRETVVHEVVARYGRIDVLINNAGVGPLAAIEDTSPELWSTIFRTNVFGLADMARLVLPHMRRNGGGRIVNVGSMGGQFTTPLGGAYHASKYAVEAVTDALRAEVAPFDVTVTLVQPGPVRTDMTRTATDVVLLPGSPYTAAAAHMEQSVTAQLDGGGRGMLTAEAVARTVVKAATVRRPRDRYKVGPVAHLMPFLRRWLPLSLWDRMMTTQTGLSKIRADQPQVVAR